MLITKESQLVTRRVQLSKFMSAVRTLYNSVVIGTECVCSFDSNSLKVFQCVDGLPPLPYTCPVGPRCQTNKFCVTGLG